ncbi:unnamed protein product, partial [marine sediment metagenome]
SLKKELVAFWEEKMERTINKLIIFDEEIRTNISDISELKKNGYK